MTTWKTPIVPACTFVLVAVLAAITAPPLASATPSHRLVVMCLATSTSPSTEHTVRVPPHVVDRLLDRTRSYRGPCAEYGQSAPRGDGRLTAYSQTEGDRPTAIGVVLSLGALSGLPHEPPSDQKWCYDIDGDGSIDPMTECANGYSNILHLDPGFRSRVDTPFRYLMVDWNPHGHGPLGVYDVPHFDAHFYLQDNEERKAIRPGPCPELVNCDDYRLGKLLPDTKYLAADFKDVDALSPGMGNHLIDTTSPEFHGEPFTHTFIYGTWDREVTFYEPMVTKAYLQGLVDGPRRETCTPVKTPAAFQETGWYPTSYCLRYRENRHEVTISMEDFVHRTAS